jgi:rod shape-determining protein MreC
MPTNCSLSTTNYSLPTTNYQLVTMRIPKTRRSVVIGVLLALLFLHWLGFSPLTRPLGFIGRAVVAPLYERIADVSENEREAELAALREAVRTVLGESYEIRDRSRAEEQSITIRSWADGRALHDIVLSRVVTQIVRDDTILYVLDRGARHGIVEGASVVMDRGVLVGRIVTVSEERALVKPLTAPEHRFAAYLDNPSKGAGIVVGVGDHSRVRMDFTPRDVAVAIDDVVITSGIDPRVPQGLLIGTVTDVLVPDNEPWQEITIRPLVHPRDIRTVGVLPQFTDER